MIRVRPIERGNRPWVVRRLEVAFGGVTVARKGVLIDASVLPSFVATDRSGRPVGLLTYDVAHGECEVVAIVSTTIGRGVSRTLMDAAHDHAGSSGCRHLWLITTNDNALAFRFYQMWGMDLCVFHRHGAPLARGQALAPEKGDRRHSAGPRARVRATPLGVAVRSAAPPRDKVCNRARNSNQSLERSFLRTS
jgi:GNAT superfamily N-acetyltransferase